MSDYLLGKSVPNPREELRLFALCDGMRWTHLPVAGGLYDQHPELMEAFRLIFSMRAEHEKREQEKREREMKQQSRSSGRVAGRRR